MIAPKRLTVSGSLRTSATRENPRPTVCATINIANPNGGLRKSVLRTGFPVLAKGSFSQKEYRRIIEAFPASYKFLGESLLAKHANTSRNSGSTRESGSASFRLTTVNASAIFFLGINALICKLQTLDQPARIQEYPGRTCGVRLNRSFLPWWRIY